MLLRSRGRIPTLACLIPEQHLPQQIAAQMHFPQAIFLWSLLCLTSRLYGTGLALVSACRRLQLLFPAGGSPTHRLYVFRPRGRFPMEATMKPRILHASRTGDAWKGKEVPALRLQGRWLEKAGIKPGDQVTVTIQRDGQLLIQRNEPEEA